MSNAYTSVEHFKRALNSGVLPPMTDVPKAVRAFIKPEYVLGYGALQEDPVRGLRCPACGVYAHDLRKHWRAHTKTIGSFEAMRKAAGLKARSRCISLRLQEQRKLSGEKTVRLHRQGTLAALARGRKNRTEWPESSWSMEYRNLRNKCDAQMAHRYLAVRDKVGRAPSGNDIKAHDPKLLKAAVKYYGSINGFLATVGAVVRKRGYTADDVCAVLGEWFKAHGKLPSARDVTEATLLPLLPSYATCLKALGFKSWTPAMSHVAFVLGVHDPRYSPKVA